MSDEQYWLAFWRSVFLAAALAISAMAGCTVHRDVLKYDAIKAGADPQALACANGAERDDQHICTLIAQRGVSK